MLWSNYVSIIITKPTTNVENFYQVYQEVLMEHSTLKIYSKKNKL